MLEFYFIEASSEGDLLSTFAHMTREQTSARSLGGIDVEPFHSLDVVWEEARNLGMKINYFDDFFLTPIQAQQLLRLLEKHRNTVRRRDAVDVMTRVLQAALARDCGVFAMCD